MRELGQNMRQVIEEEDQYMNLTGSYGKEGFIDQFGNLTKSYRAELKQFGREASKLEDEHMLKQHGGSTDIFGVHRVGCKVCEHECPGYMASLTIFKPVSEENDL
jgi:hypothetical protein